jgi:TonB family protein
VPIGSPQNWITNDDYPPEALRAAQSGTVGFRLDINATGAVTACTVVHSSMSQALDDKTCTLMMMRARFTPGRDEKGRAIATTWTTRMRWELPDGYVPPPLKLRRSWAHVQQFTVGEDGKVSNCTDHYAGEADRPTRSCADALAMDLDITTGMRGDSKGPIMVMIREGHAVAGLPMASIPPIPEGFRPILDLTVRYDVSESGTIGNCRATEGQGRYPRTADECSYVLPYVPGQSSISVTATLSMLTTGDVDVMRPGSAHTP